MFRRASRSKGLTAVNGESMKVVLEVIEGPHAGHRWEFRNHDNFIVGRSSQAHFRLPSTDMTFSRFHFLIEMNPPNCRLIDMASRNGTFLNGKPVSVAMLADGDEIRGGASRFLVKIEAEDSEELGILSSQWSMPRLAITGQRPEDGKTAPASVADDEELVSVGPYEILSELGRGGMGIVYKARHKETGKIRALKTIRPAVFASDSILARFLREVSILRRLRHPNIVEYRDFGHDQGRLYMAMEYVHGANAYKLRKRAGGKLPIPLAIEIGCQVLDALGYAHAQGFIHRDIKPRNILVTRRDGAVLVKVADFGLGRIYQDSPMSGLSFTGEIAGTAGYLPPEQVTDFRGTDARADQYALGATLYHLISGHKIHDYPQNLAQQLLMILQEEPAPIRQRNPEIPEPLAAAIHRALARNPADRYADVIAMKQAMEPFRSGPASESALPSGAN